MATVKTASAPTAAKSSITGAKTLKDTLHDTISTKPAAKSKPAETKATSKTRITVRYNTGFNNSLYIRGSGANLNWNKGVELKNVNADTWVWETSSKFDRCEFKILLNDSLYENGPNQQVTAGKQLEHTPRFN